MRLYDLACSISAKGAAAFGHPVAVLLFPILCAAAVLASVQMEAQTYILSVLAISTTQMVLVQGYADRKDDRRREEASHAKLDELLIATGGARSELAHIEDKSEEEIAGARK